MKNIHVLPTDKPSRLFYNVGGALLFTNYENYNGVNIYITSDEKLPYDSSIFNNGAFYHRDVAGDVHIITKHTFKPNPNFCKKIILTTDQDLIKDGVQAVEEDFLNWFVKNQSCNRVEIQLDKVYNKNRDSISYYKIIIPKEEPKQETLEEAKYNAYKEYWNENHTQEVKSNFLTAFKLGAKWQQERMYSEEDMRISFDANIKDWISFEEFIEQFKNK